MKIKEVILKRKTYKLKKFRTISSTKELIVTDKENNSLYNIDLFCAYISVHVYMCYE